MFVSNIGFSADLSAFDTANQKMDCLIAADTLAQRQLCVTGSKTSTLEVVSKTSKAVTEQEAHHWKVVGANPAKAAYRAAKGRTQIAHKVTTDLNAMKVVAADVANIAPAIIDEILDSRNLLSGDDLKNHQAQWNVMLKNKARYVDFIKRGDQLDYLSFRNGVKANVVADFDGNLLVMVFPLADGRELLWIAECQNFAIRHHAPPPVVTPPTPATNVPPVKTYIPPTPKEVEAMKEYAPDAELFVFKGADWSHSGKTNFQGVEGAFYPVVIENADGTKDELGVGGIAQQCDGHTVGGFGYACNQWAAGLAYKHIDSEWDVSAKLMYGQFVETGHSQDDKYKSRRTIDLISVGGGVNWYGREKAGEKWFPETQGFWRVGLPIGKQVQHSWEGQNIEDTKDLKKFSGLINVGVRQIIYAGDYARPYIEVGYFGELPTAQSVRAQLGVSDKWKVLFCSLGPSFSLMDPGGVSLVGSCGIDVSNAARLAIKTYRQHEFEATLKNYDAETGGFTIEGDNVGLEAQNNAGQFISQTTSTGGARMTME